jgi:hypothetical protein
MSIPTFRLKFYSQTVANIKQEDGESKKRGTKVEDSGSGILEV